MMRTSKNLPQGLIALTVLLCASASMAIIIATTETISDTVSPASVIAADTAATPAIAEILTRTASANQTTARLTEDISAVAGEMTRAAAAVPAQGTGTDTTAVATPAAPSPTNTTTITAEELRQKLEAAAQSGKEIVQDECSALGVDNLAECKAYIVKEYKQRIECPDSWSDAQCQASIQAAYSDAIFYAGKRYEIIKKKIDTLNQGDLSVSELESALNEGLQNQDIILSLKNKETRVKALKAIEGLVLDQDGLISSAPLAIAIDSDGDGIPDDTERRLGTDPDRSDSDGDGHTDAEEILSGYNPLGDGSLQLNLSDIDRVLIENQPIENPIASGEEKATFSISKFENAATASSQAAGMNGYVLSGTADPNRTLTLYIYSDIPIVTTVTTDQYGNWQYHFDEPLEDGQHEVYVAINDNTGKVVSKSRPLDFLIKDAQAFTIGDTATSGSSVSDSMINYYILSALLLIFFGILAFFFAILKQKNKFQS